MTRNELVLLLEEVEKRVRQARNSVSPHSYHCEDWPKEAPVPPSMIAAASNLERTVESLELIIGGAKKDYRMQVLQWLLAETEATEA